MLIELRSHEKRAWCRLKTTDIGQCRKSNHEISENITLQLPQKSVIKFQVRDKVSCYRALFV